MQIRLSNLVVALSLLCTVLLSGCGISGTPVPAVSSVVVAGEVYGGALPVNGAHVYLLAANTQGYAGPGITASSTNASISLLKSATGTTVDSKGNYYVTTGSGGQFSISGDYTACTTGQQLYLYSSGGNAMGGNPNGTGGINGENTAAGMLAILGECSTISSSTVVHMNEMTTIAAAYALAGFSTDATHIADDESVSTNATQSLAKIGMANAFLNASNIVDAAKGSALATTPAGNGTVPIDTLNTLANILAGCVQSTGSSSTPCSDLFSFTGTPTSSDTATAAINLAHHPAGVSGSSVTITKLFNDIEPNTAFQPNLSSAPNDFTIAISFANDCTSLGNVCDPVAIAVDGLGGVWVGDLNPTYEAYDLLSHYAGTDASYASSLVSGVKNNTGLGVYGVAIDTNNNAYGSLAGDSAVEEFPGPSSSTPYLAQDPGMISPVGLASETVNGISDLFSSNSNQSPEIVITEVGGSNFNSTTSYKTGLSSDVAGPGIAIDGAKNVWVGLTTGVGEFLDSNSFNTYNHFTGSVSNATGIAIDAGNNVWVASSGNDSVVEFTGSGSSYTAKSPLTGGGVSSPNGLVIDGAGNVWVSNFNTASITGFNSIGTALSPTNGYTGTAGQAGGTNGPLVEPEAIAVDNSGNVWVADYTNVTVMYVGLGAPVVTPIAEAIAINKLGTRP